MARVISKKNGFWVICDSIIRAFLFYSIIRTWHKPRNCFQSTNPITLWTYASEHLIEQLTLDSQIPLFIGFNDSMISCRYELRPPPNDSKWSHWRYKQRLIAKALSATVFGTGGNNTYAHVSLCALPPLTWRRRHSLLSRKLIPRIHLPSISEVKLPSLL